MKTELTARLRQELAAALRQEELRLTRSIRSLDEAIRVLSESQGEESGAGGAMADVASDLAEQSVDLAIGHAQQTRLAEVRAALVRLAQGDYGACERCGLPIGGERLYALPWTRYCRSCADERPSVAPVGRQGKCSRARPVAVRSGSAAQSVSETA